MLPAEADVSCILSEVLKLAVVWICGEIYAQSEVFSVTFGFPPRVQSQTGLCLSDGQRGVLPYQ